eukprot:4197024-Karenia_brevis.AAC.1
MLDAAKVAKNINLKRLASQGETAKQRKLNSNIAECIAAAGDRSEYELLKNGKTNVVITTFGMTSKTHNAKGSLELAIPCEKCDVVFEDEKQNEN